MTTYQDQTLLEKASLVVSSPMRDSTKETVAKFLSLLEYLNNNPIPAYTESAMQEVDTLLRTSPSPETLSTLLLTNTFVNPEVYRVVAVAWAVRCIDRAGLIEVMGEVAKSSTFRKFARSDGRLVVGF